LLLLLPWPVSLEFASNQRSSQAAKTLLSGPAGG
jgi:hypothetical protein